MKWDSLLILAPVLIPLKRIVANNPQCLIPCCHSVGRAKASAKTTLSPKCSGFLFFSQVHYPRLPTVLSWIDLLSQANYYIHNHFFEHLHQLHDIIKIPPNDITHSPINFTSGDSVGEDIEVHLEISRIAKRNVNW